MAFSGLGAGIGGLGAKWLGYDDMAVFYSALAGAMAVMFLVYRKRVDNDPEN